MGRKKNAEAIVQIIILLTAACLLIYSVITKKVTYYVHPRFYFGIYISIIILILFAASIFSNIKKARHNANLMHYIIFAIPLLTAIVFPAAAINGKDFTISGSDNVSVAKEQNITNSQSGTTTDSSDTNDNLNSTSNTSSDTQSTIQDEDNSDATDNNQAVLDKYSQYEVNGVMVISDDIFAQWVDDVYSYPDVFEGKKFQYLAQVFSMDDIKETQFLAGRYFMVCCAADLVGYGILCESENRSQLKDDQWITVTGTIEKYEYNGSTVPMLTDTSISDAKAPAVEYIYYNNY